MLQLHHADDLEPLLDSLAEVLRVPPADPFTPDLVVVPAVGMQDAAQTGIGRRLGIATNLEFVFPGRFLARALGDTTPTGQQESDPWRLPRLTWSVLEELHEGAVEVPGVSAASTGATARWSLARRIADLFDRYASQRAAIVEQWAEGIDGDGTFDAGGHPLPLPDSRSWQPRLWRRVRERIGAPNPIERLGELLPRIERGEVVPNLPPRVMVFGVGSLPPTMLRVLSAVSAQREVHVFLRHPSAGAWSTRHALGGGLNQRANVDCTDDVTHPLLASWGRPALETRSLLQAFDGLGEIPEGHAPEGAPTTVLQALQYGIRRDRELVVHADLRPDDSLQVHACHGALRQLEVLRDALGHAFVADPTLQAHEVIVLCPEIATYAPLVDAVFNRGELPVPVRVGDRSLTTDEPVAQTLAQVLSLVSGRATLSEVLSLVQLAPVRRRLGWGGGDVEQAAQWATMLGARWGLLAEHRAAWDSRLGVVEEGTWRAVLDRMISGIACPAPTPRTVVGDTAPFDDVAVDDFDVVGGFADLLERLLRLHDEVQHERPVDEWVELLHRTVDDFCGFDPDEPWRRAVVQRELADIERSARDPKDPDVVCGVPLSLGDVRAMLSHTLGERAGRVPLRSGSVTLTSMVPQHGVAARVVCILGLDEGTFTGGSFDGDDLLGLRPCVGERHPRHDGRQMLLDAVLAARERLVITCNGADLTTNAEVPFTVPLAELLDVVHALLPGGAGSVVVRHPRHGFSESALQAGAIVPHGTTPFTFDRSMVAAAVAKRSMSNHPDLSWSLQPLPQGTVDLQKVVDAIANPAKVFLRDRLEVRLPGESEVAEDGLPVAVDHLTASSLARQLLDTVQHGGTFAQWSPAARLAGGMPPGQLADAVLDTAKKLVDSVVEEAEAWGASLTASDELTFDLLLGAPESPSADAAHGVGDPLTVQATVRGLMIGPTTSRLVRIQASNVRPAHELAMAVQVAALQLHQPHIRWQGVIIGNYRNGVGGAAVQVAGDGDARAANAADLLSMALQVHEWSMRGAVPLFDRASKPLSRGLRGAAAAALEDDLKYDTFRRTLWPELTFDAWTSERVADTDPQSVRAVAERQFCGRAEALARWVWDTWDSTMEALDASGTVVAGDDAADGDENYEDER